jgi:hypothetical protein
MRLASCSREPVDHPSLRAPRRGDATDAAAGTGVRSSLTNICGQFTDLAHLS